MTKTAEYMPMSPEADEEKQTLRRRLIATGAFLGLSTAAVIGQHTGFNENMAHMMSSDPNIADGIESVANSMAHPGIGYISAMLTVWAADHLRHKPPVAMSAVVGGTIGNFGVETLQDMAFSAGSAISSSAEANSHFWEAAQAVETPKDYAFALGGVATYLISEKVANVTAKRKSSASSRDIL